MDLFNKNKVKLLEQENQKLKEQLLDDSLLEKNKELKTLNMSIAENIRLQEKHLKELYIDDVCDLSELNYQEGFNQEFKRRIDTLKYKEQHIDDVIIIQDAFGYSDKELKSISLFAQIVFDTKCDYLISKLKYNTKNNLTIKIKSIATRVANKCDFCQLKFNSKYVDLKIEAAYVTLLYKNKIQQEKERLAKEAEILKDQLKADKEIKKQLENNEKELTNLKYQYNKLKESGRNAQDIQDKIDVLQIHVNHDNERLTKKKSGYVYVVGNRDMKNGLLKIGITKRNIEKRMQELGGASHSFPMEVYGYVFVDNCYELETKLHKYFKDKRLNSNNTQKEWFITDFDNIKTAFKEVANINIKLSEKPCEDYLKSREKFVDFYK